MAPSFTAGRPDLTALFAPPVTPTTSELTSTSESTTTPSTMTSTRPSPEQAQPVKVRIVVADDDRDILDLVVFKLTQAGYDTIAVGDGDAALAAIRAELPRLAILDVMMPGLSGMDVLRTLRADEATQDLDVILLTARARDSDVDTGFAVGASDYVIKPFSPRELIHRVNALLTRDVDR